MPHLNAVHSAQPCAWRAGGDAEDLGTGHAPDLPVLTKIEVPIVQSCDAYNLGPNSIAPGSVQIVPVPQYVPPLHQF